MRVIAIKSQVVTCYSCGAWLGRAPLFYGEGDKGDYCHKCNSTAVRVRDGRPYGPKSRDWARFSAEAEELLQVFADDKWGLQELCDGLVLTQQPPKDGGSI